MLDLGTACKKDVKTFVMQRSLFCSLLALYSTLVAAAFTGQDNEGNNLSVDEVMDRYIEAMGGRAALEQINSARLRGRVLDGNQVVSTITVLKKVPDRVRVVIDSGRSRFVQGFDGETVWFSRHAGGQVFHGRMPKSQAEKFIEEAPLTNYLVRYREEPDLVFELGEDVELNRIPCYKIIARFPDGSWNVHIIERERFLERRIYEYDADGNRLLELIPSQFERVGGVDFAMRIVRRKEGENLSTLVLDEVEINIGILEDAFRPPPELAGKG